jgi:hypothetical protein
VPCLYKNGTDNIDASVFNSLFVAARVFGNYLRSTVQAGARAPFLTRVCIPITRIDLLIYLFSARAPRAVLSNFFPRQPHMRIHAAERQFAANNCERKANS